MIEASSIAAVLHLMDRVRRDPSISFDDPDTNYMGAAYRLAKLIASDHNRFSASERSDIVAAGAIILRHLWQVSGADNLAALLAARAAERETGR